MRDDLRWNKIFGAILATGLAILLLRTGAEMLFETHAPAKPGYAIAVTEAAGEGGADTADVPPDWGTVLPTADAAAGAVVANKCKSCHNFDNGGPNQTGPNLWGALGRKPGSHPGFAYSGAMTDLGGKVPAWDYEHLNSFLKGPQAYLSGTKMSFVGLKKREDRINLIAWLRQQGSTGVAIPAPNPAPAPAAAAPATADGSKPAPTAATGVAATTDPKAPVATGQVGPTNAAAGTPNSGVTPSTGAARAPSAVNDSPGGKSPSEGAEKDSRKKQ